MPLTFLKQKLSFSFLLISTTLKNNIKNECHSSIYFWCCLSPHLEAFVKISNASELNWILLQVIFKVSENILIYMTLVI